MNESDKRELEQLKQRQKLLEQQLVALAGHIRHLELRMTSPATPTAAPASNLAAEQQPQTPTIPLRRSGSAPIAVPPVIAPPVTATVAQTECVDASEPTIAAPSPEFVPGFLRTDSHKPGSSLGAATAVSPPPHSRFAPRPVFLQQIKTRDCAN